MRTIAAVGSAIRALLSEERGVTSYEYLLVVGSVVVLMAATMIAGFALFMPQFLGLVCPSVDTAADPIATIGSCIEMIAG